MGWKILDENDEIVYEFKDHEPAADWLSIVFLKSKFGEAFDPLMVTTSENQWQYEILKACTDRLHHKWPSNGRAKDSMGYTKADDTWENLFLDIEKFFVTHASETGWAKAKYQERQRMIRCAIYPHPISDRRAKDLIEDVDQRLKRYSQAYNPEYNHDA